MDLAKKGDPYVGGDGKLITPEDMGDANQELEERRRLMPEVAKLFIAKSIKIDDLPEADKQQQTVIAAVVTLKLMGLTEIDIADVMDTDFQTIQNIVNLPSTQATFERLFKNLINANADTVHGRISSYANDAVDVVKDLMDDKDTRDDVRLKAAQDILDRSGTNADHFFSQETDAAAADDELRISIMDTDGTSERVSVEIKRK